MRTETRQPWRLDRKAALVTGATSGMGTHRARVLREAGAQVVLTDISTSTLLTLSNGRRSLPRSTRHWNT
jgi:NADP-dependent 3-hydroxy acid dehydrogenase YdfG